MRRGLCTILGVQVLLVGLSLVPGCGGRGGSCTFDTTLDETLDAYVHPTRRAVLELVGIPPEALKGVDRFAGQGARYADLHLGNLIEEHQYLALAEGPDGVVIVLDGNLDLDLSNDGPHPFHPYEEDSPYFLSDTLVVAYPVDTGGVRHRMERKVQFIHKRGEEGWLRFDFVGHRTGELDHLEGEPYGYILFDADNNGYYDHRDILVIDTNRDGVIDGNRNSVERYTMSEPFLLGDRAFEVIGLNSRGTRFSIVPFRRSFTPHDRLEIGEAAPDFTLKDVTGTGVSLGDFSGKTILLPFWASW